MNVGNNYIFIINNAKHSKNTCKWIKNLVATEYMILYRATFDTYEIITTPNVYLDGESHIKAIEIGSIVMKAKSTDIVSKMYFTCPSCKPHCSW